VVVDDGRPTMRRQQALEMIARHVGGSSVATAESITAGRIARHLATVPGAEDFFRGGLVAYQEPVKRALLGVEAASIYTPRAACEMAAGAARLLDASVAVATSGVAGERPVDGVPPGTVFIGLSVDGEVRAFTYQFDGEPVEVAEHASEQALVDLARALADKPMTVPGGPADRSLPIVE
jgi:nicotinamide-nucleotide amidase